MQVKARHLKEDELDDCEVVERAPREALGDFFEERLVDRPMLVEDVFQMNSLDLSSMSMVTSKAHLGEYEDRDVGDPCLKMPSTEN